MSELSGLLMRLETAKLVMIKISLQFTRDGEVTEALNFNSHVATITKAINIIEVVEARKCDIHAMSIHEAINIIKEAAINAQTK